MYCPRCGKEQPTETPHFCVACGFQLVGIAETLSTGRPPVDRKARRAALIGFSLVTLSAAFLVATLILGTPEPSFVVQMNLFIAVLIYLAALSYVLLKFVRKGRDSWSPVNHSDVVDAVTDRDLSLPEKPTGLGPAPARVEAPPSVIEDTTTLLSRE